ncbi:MAG: LamG domain-containing protein [Bacillota bacterium]
MPKARTDLPQKGRLVDLSKGMVDVVHPALLDDAESRLLKNASLDEKGTLKPCKGRVERYAAPFNTAAACSGISAFYKSDGTSRLLVGTADGKLYADTPHVIQQWDTQGDFNSGQHQATVATSDGKVWPMVVSTGFEDGYFADFHTRDSGWTIDDTVYKTGTKSAKGTGTSQKLVREFGFGVSQAYVKLAVRFAETNVAHYPVIFKSPTDTEIQAVVADADGNFKYHNGTALAAFPVAKTYAANTWYVVEVWVRGGTFWVSIDGVSLTPSGLAMKDTANAAQSQVSKFQAQNAGATAATMWLDDVTISLLDPVFSRASVAYKSDGFQVAANKPRYEYHTLPAPVWQDTFDTDQLSQYTSGGDVAATWTVSGGVLTAVATSGQYVNAWLNKTNLLLSNFRLKITSDQLDHGGIVFCFQDNLNYYFLRAIDDGSTAGPCGIAVVNRVAGVNTEIASTVDVNWPRGTAKVIEVQKSGSVIEAWFDGVKIISISDTTFTGGGVGLRCHYGTNRYLDFTVYYVQQGVMAEEGTTNLYAQSNLSTFHGYPSNTAAVQQANGFWKLSFGTDIEWLCNSQITITNGQTYTESFYFYCDGTPGTFDITFYTANGHHAVPATIVPIGYSPAIGKFLYRAYATYTTVAGDDSIRCIDINNKSGGTWTYIAIGWAQLEQKAYPTSYAGDAATRAAEVLTVPTAGVFNKGNWTVKLRFTPTSNPVSGPWHRLFEIVIDSSNYYRLLVTPQGYLYLAIGSGGVEKGTLDNAVIAVGQTYFISISGNGSVMRLFKNGTQVGSDTAYTEPVGTLPANMYVGCAISGGDQANGIISDFALMNKAQTLAEHQAEYNTGLPLSVDDATTYLMSCDGSLNISVSHHWISPVIDCSNATDKGSGHAALTAETPGASTVAIASRSAPTSNGPWTEWVNALADGTLQHAADNYVQVRLLLNRSGADDPNIDKLVVSFDGQPAVTLLAIDFTAGSQFFFGTLLDTHVIVDKLDAPRKYDGTTLALLGGLPPHAQYVAAHKNYLFVAHSGSNPSRLYFSDILNLESWPALNFIDISPNDGDWITGLLPYDDYLIIAKKRSIWLLIGSGPSDFEVRRLHAEAGCVAPRSLVRVGNGFAFVAHNGIYFSDMSQPLLISERLKTTWQNLNRRRLNLACAAFYDHKLRVDVPNGGSPINNLRIIYDSIRKALFLEEFTEHASCYAAYVEAGQENLLYGHANEGQVSQADTGDSDAGQPINFVWESKHFDIGLPEHIKRWRKLYMEFAPAATDTQVSVSFIVDGGTPSSPITLTVPGNATKKVHTARLLPSQVGVVQGHSIGYRVTQSATNGGVGIHASIIDYFVKGERPTL